MSTTLTSSQYFGAHKVYLLVRLLSGQPVVILYTRLKEIGKTTFQRLYSGTFPYWGNKYRVNCRVILIFAMI